MTGSTSSGSTERNTGDQNIRDQQQQNSQQGNRGAPGSSKDTMNSNTNAMKPDEAGDIADSERRSGGNR